MASTVHFNTAWIPPYCYILESFSPVHEPQGEKGRDAVGGNHEDDANDLTLLPRLDEVGQVKHDLSISTQSNSSSRSSRDSRYTA